MYYSINKTRLLELINKQSARNPTIDNLKSGGPEDVLGERAKAKFDQSEITPETTLKYILGFQEVLDLWNKQSIVPHDSPSKGMFTAFEQAIQRFSLQEVQRAIERYGVVIRGSRDGEYWFNYEWTLEEFLRKENALPKFLEDECLSTFKKKKSDEQSLKDWVNGKE